MPYIPYWFESFAPCFPWVVPVIAVIGLWVANLSVDKRMRQFAQHTYYATMLVVAWGTLRTVLVDEGCWILHMGSVGLMVLGATFPTGESDSETLISESNLL